MKKSRVFSFLGFSSLLVIILLMNLGCVSRGDSGETKDKMEEKFKAADTFVDFLQTGPFEIHLPEGWRVYREEGNEEILLIVNTDGELQIEIVSLMSRQGMNIERVGMFFAGKSGGTIRSKVSGMIDGYSGYFITMESGLKSNTIDLLDSICVWSGFEETMKLFPYVSIQTDTGDIRIMENYSFHSLSSQWRWYSDSIEGFILYHPGNDVFFTLFGTNKPDLFNLSEKGKIEYLETGIIELLIDTYKVPVSYASFLNNDEYFINLEIPIGEETHYAQFSFPSIPDTDIEELINTESFQNLFNVGLHIGKRYPLNREDLTVHLQMEE